MRLSAPLSDKDDERLKPGKIPVYVSMMLGSHIAEIRKLQRSINTYNMRYFPQHVLLCTGTVHDQSGDICIQGYLRIL